MRSTETQLLGVTSGLSWLLDGDVEAAERTWRQVSDTAGGYMPAVCAETIVTTARARHDRHAGDTPKAEPQGCETSATDGPAATPGANGEISGDAAAALEPRSERDPSDGERSPADAERAQEAPSNAPDRERTMVDEAMQIATVLDEARRHGYGAATVQALAGLLYGERGVEQLGAAELDKLRDTLASAHAGATSDAKLREALAEAEQQPDRATAAEVLQRWLQTRARNKASKAA